MSYRSRLGSTALVVCLLAGCGKTPESGSAMARPTSSVDASHATADAAGTPLAHARRAFASLPDRGELLTYSTQNVLRDGAYTWHRASISESHALHAMADGHLRLIAPSGTPLDIQYDRHVEHPSGDWTWIGHLPGHPEQQTILTFGEHAAFGSIAQPEGLPLRLTTRGGASWLVETDPRRVATIDNAATHPTRPDFKLPPRDRDGRPGPAADRATALASAPAPLSATASATTTVDVLIGYTAAFAAANGGASGALTRLNFMVDVTNAAYTNSAISAKVRLVHAMQVSYPDATSNESALYALTGSTGSTQTAPDPAFNALRSAREQYGADLVSLVRKYDDPTNAGCGVAWLIGGGQSGVSTGDSSFGYSVVSDGTDAGTDGKTYYCLDETLAHELGHNMGAAHDVATAEGADNVLQADEYGAFPYSFGYKTTSSNGNFYTIMAYGDTGQTIYRIFSDPRSTFCGGHACGNASTADNARTLTQTVSTIASFRASRVGAGAPPDSDFDGDGSSDILWTNTSSGANVIWKSANDATAQAVSPLSSLAWKADGIGDFDGDGQSDILWRNHSSGANVIWKSGNSATPQSMAIVGDQHWIVAGVGDFDADGHSDILWRNVSTGADLIWRSGNSALQVAVATASPAWSVAGVEDFNGDGRSDVLWRNSSSGANVIWKSADASTVQSMPAVSTIWIVAGVGDFDGDGNGDVLWRSNAGANVIWKSGSPATQQAVATATTDWSVVGVHDYDGDQRADVLWRRSGTTGANVIWKSGSSSTPQAVRAVPDLSWKVAN